MPNLVMYLLLLLHRSGQYWGATFLLLGLTLLIWAAFIHPDWQRPRSMKLHRALKRAGWYLLGFSLAVILLTFFVRSWIMVDHVQY